MSNVNGQDDSTATHSILITDLEILLETSDRALRLDSLNFIRLQIIAESDTTIMYRDTTIARQSRYITKIKKERSQYFNIAKSALRANHRKNRMLASGGIGAGVAVLSDDLLYGAGSLVLTYIVLTLRIF